MNRVDKFSTIKDIADAMSTNDASQEQIQSLEGLLKGNIEAQRFYYDYMSMHAHLLSGPQRNMEFVYRRVTEVTHVTEELVVRPQTTQTQVSAHKEAVLVQPHSKLDAQLADFSSKNTTHSG